MWPKLAEHLGVAAAEYPGHAQPLEQQMAGMEAVWNKIVAKHNLQKNPSRRLLHGGTAMQIWGGSLRTLTI